MAWSVQAALHRPQNVAGGQDHARGGDDRQQRAVVPGAEHGEDFADEPAQARQAQAGEEDADGHTAVQRHQAEQAAELVQVAVMHPVVNHADHKEHAGRGDAVGDHLEHRAVHAHRPVVAVDVGADRFAIFQTAMPSIT